MEVIHDKDIAINHKMLVDKDCFYAFVRKKYEQYS